MAGLEDLLEEICKWHRLIVGLQFRVGWVENDIIDSQLIRFFSDENVFLLPNIRVNIGGETMIDYQRLRLD